MKKSYISFLIIFGIIILINIISSQFFFRLDMTKEKVYTLSDATKNLMKNLDETVTVDVYFSDGLPPQYNKILDDFTNLLIDYNRISKGKLEYSITNPNESEDLEMEARRAGVQPLQIQVREKDEVSMKKAYMGAIIAYENKKEIIPVMKTDIAMEYDLTLAIKKMSKKDKPPIAVLSGHGESSDEALQHLSQAISVLNTPQSLDLSSGGELTNEYKVGVMINPTDSIPEHVFAILDKYLESGGNICLAYNNVYGDFQSVQGKQLHTGIDEWLASKGLVVEKSFVIDENCGMIRVQQRQGRFSMNTSVEFPFFPSVSSFVDHTITTGIDQVIFPFASPMSFTSTGAYDFEPLVITSQMSGLLAPPLTFDVSKKWNRNDFTEGAQIIAGVLNPLNRTDGKIIVFSDGDFVTNAQNMQSDNVNLITNCIDWLTDDSGLIDIRSKSVASRPIENVSDERKATLKWFNFLLPIILVVAYGIIRIQTNRRKRMKRMEMNMD